MLNFPVHGQTYELVIDTVLYYWRNFDDPDDQIPRRDAKPEGTLVTFDHNLITGSSIVWLEGKQYMCPTACYGCEQPDQFVTYQTVHGPEMNYL